MVRVLYNRSSIQGIITKENRKYGLDRFQIHVVVKVQVVQVLKLQVSGYLMTRIAKTNLPVDEQVQHVVSLPANL